MLTRTRRPRTESPPAARLGRAAAVSQRAADRLCPGREPRGDAPGARDGARLSWAGRYPLLIGGEEIDTEPRRLDSVDPSQSSRVVGRVALAGRRARRSGGGRGPGGVPGLGGDAGARPRRHLDQGRGDHAEPPLRAGRLGGLRMRQALGRGGCRRRRGHRLLRVLRPRDDPPGRAEAPRRARRDQFHRAHSARRGRGHPSLELPAGDPHAA